MKTINRFGDLIKVNNGWKTLKSLFPLIILSALCCGGITALAQTDILIATNSVWKYLDDGSDQGTAWRGSGFNDASWPSGTAPLGYGMTSITTTNAAGRITYYYRKSFTVPCPTLYSNLTVRLRRDDGGIVYLNGVEVFRSNMPTGAVTFATLASSSISGAAQFQYFSTNVTSPLPIAGTNVVAVEIHQASTNNVDSAFDLELTGQRVTLPSYTNTLVPGQNFIANQDFDGIQQTEPIRLLDAKTLWRRVPVRAESGAKQID